MKADTANNYTGYPIEYSYGKSSTFMSPKGGGPSKDVSVILNEPVEHHRTTKGV